MRLVKDGKTKSVGKVKIDFSRWDKKERVVKASL